MDLDLTAEQQQLVDALDDFLTANCPTGVVRASEPTGFDPGLWRTLSAIAGPAVGVPEARGGEGASLLDLELVAERIGRFLAPVPFVESAVCARLLAGAGDRGAEPLGELVGDPARVGTVALRPAEGGLARLVPGGAVADIVVALDGDELVAVEDAGPGTPPANLGSSALADRPVDRGRRTVLATGGDARELFGRALDEWRALTGGALVGLGAAALALGVDYAQHRHQFGVPIGSFQSVARDLADVATLVDGAELLAREAGWAQTEQEEQFPALAAMALLFATRAARRASAAALHVHGGYGFTLEYDIQLYYRRAQAWPLALGDPRRGVATLADALFGPVEVA